MSGRDKHAVIAEAERGEDVANATYEEALSRASLSPDVRNVISRQAIRIKQARDALRDLERVA